MKETNLYAFGDDRNNDDVNNVPNPLVSNIKIQMDLTACTHTHEQKIHATREKQNDEYLCD